MYFIGQIKYVCLSRMHLIVVITNHIQKISLCFLIRLLTFFISSIFLFIVVVLK